jgi:hypothetical protein
MACHPLDLNPKTFFLFFLRINNIAGHRWLTSVILATQEAEIGRISV